MNELKEEKNAAQGSPMAIVLEELADMKRNYEKALSRIAQLENVLRNSLTPQHPGCDISKVTGSPQAALPPRALIDHSDREEPLRNKQRTYAEVAKIPAGAQAHVKKLQTKYASCVLKKSHNEHRGPPVVKALYFKGFNFQEIKDKELYDDLRTCLPQRAVLRLSFIGGSIVEILTDAPFPDRTKSTLQQMGLTCVN